MRSLLSLCLVLGATLLLQAPQLEAQRTYQSAIGARLGYPLSASYKTFINDSHAIEAYLNFRRWGSILSGRYSYTRIGVGAAYLVHQEISDEVPNLLWYFGGGAGIYFYNYPNDSFFDDEDNLGFGIQGFIGLDYKFEDAPVNLTLDYAPAFYIGGYDAAFSGVGGSLGVRYVLSE